MPSHAPTSATIAADQSPTATLPSELIPDLDRLCDTICRGLAATYRRRTTASMVMLAHSIRTSELAKVA